MTKHEIILMLYAMGQESGTAYEHMEYLCAALEVPYPPNPYNAIDVSQKVSQHLLTLATH